jgi:hypothetical protein
MTGTVQRTGQTGMLPSNYVEPLNWFAYLMLRINIYNQIELFLPFLDKKYF